MLSIGAPLRLLLCGMLLLCVAHRYGDTAFHVYGRWYGGGPPWDDSTDAARSLRLVNNMHRRVADAIAALPLQEFDRRVDDQFPHISDMPASDPQIQILFQDLAALRAQFPASRQYRAFVRNPLKFTQFDMMLVQCAFFAASLLYPAHYGCQVELGRKYFKLR
jgi:hypothetical protein